MKYSPLNLFFLVITIVGSVSLQNFFPLQIGGTTILLSICGVAATIYLIRRSYTEALLYAVLTAFIIDSTLSAVFGEQLLAISVLLVTYIFLSEFIFKQRSQIFYVVCALGGFILYFAILWIMEYSALGVELSLHGILQYFMSVGLTTLLFIILLPFTQRAQISSSHLFYE